MGEAYNQQYQHKHKQCVVCDENKQQGIHLFDSFICEDCEREIVLTDTKDKLYKYYLEKLRKIKLPSTS
ncbi:sigma factor G inhibitor Gin [Desertibacillus haloalkaliphilus]|uniref:sigma factor G inhibitor Gin n=1 Tax=Desertibacillus haloalkaliphilus TaxID=1328930 RepID=UPI001C25DF20|nr:sigma factor G inhibitor Gin [Desertibacillus haloalkaliphilus]MBU8908402.1 sigma factor G inhibitor Gin [Desertibacillus haloalkaliphilus]